MVTVNQVAQHLLNLGPQKNIPRQAFYHYLKNFYALEAEFRQDMVDAFYDRAMGFTYWQNEKDQLGRTVQKDLLSLAAQQPVGFDVQDILHAHEVQWINLIENRDIEALLLRELKQREQNLDWHKVIRINPQQVLCLLGRPEGDLRVEVRSHLAVIENGQLVPVRPQTVLHYDSSLELDPQHDQVLADSKLSCLRFRFTEKGYEGVSLQGHTFQKTKFLMGSINQYPELFYGIKRLERYFINPQTDPFYQELTIIIEKALRLFKHRHPDAIVIAREALKKGRLAIKDVFPNDKDLRILLSHLETELRSVESWPKERHAQAISPRERHPVSQRGVSALTNS